MTLTTPDALELEHVTVNHGHTAGKPCDWCDRTATATVDAVDNTGRPVETDARVCPVHLAAWFGPSCHRRITHTATVAADKLTAHRGRIRRAGGVVTMSAPVAAGYVVTWTDRDAR